MAECGMGRLDDRATQPQRGPADMLRWKLVDPLRARRRRDDEFAAWALANELPDSRLWLLDVGEVVSLDSPPLRR